MPERVNLLTTCHPERRLDYRSQLSTGRSFGVLTSIFADYLRSDVFRHDKSQADLATYQARPA